MATGYDIIGDIHGHITHLRALLSKLGYKNGVHPDGRKVVFLGDFVDRGPGIREVLELVRQMLLDGHHAVMGNHELNAILYALPDGDGGFFREHTPQNFRLHEETLLQLGEDLREWLEWMSALPTWIDFGNFRAVHACWCDSSIKAMKGKKYLRDLGTAEDISKKEHPVNRLLKGLEFTLPDNGSWNDLSGHNRTEIRIQWWLSPHGLTYNSALMPSGVEKGITDAPLSAEDASCLVGHSGPPTFVGHYWLRDPRPGKILDNLACLDYSVARNGYLCAYRFDGEETISNDKFVWV